MNAPIPSRVRAFSLVEMIVAVAAVALLTVGVGQLFQSVTAFTGAGSGLAEVDQMGRAIQAQLRTDFEALNRLRQEEAFVAIRNRRQRVYLHPEDRDADLRAGRVAADPKSRAVWRRLDEIMFFGFGEFTSAQLPSNPVAQPVRAQVARIYYGHGLRPSPDRDFDPENPPSDSNVPRRRWIPDGDFGQAPGETNRFNNSSDFTVTGRNQFGAQWLLLRQPLLLSGGLVAGSTVNGVTSQIDPSLTYAPFVRENENRSRWTASPPFPGTLTDNEDADAWPRSAALPDPRALAWGRVDICAQSPERARLWLEGEGVRDSDTQRVNPDETAFDSGLLNSKEEIDALLWNGQQSSTNPDVIREAMMAGLHRSIGGMFTRYLAEADPPLVDRRDVLDADEPSADLSGRDDPQLALMDLHAVLGARCSNFEVAWSDGSTWLRDQPFVRPASADGSDPGFTYRRGDIIWFDINLFRNGPGPNDDLSDAGRNAYYPRTDPFIAPEIAPSRRVQVLTGPALAGFNLPVYALVGTGELALVNNPARASGVDSNGTNWEVAESYAIFPFRVPNGSTGYDGPFPKPKMIRIRVTLHDSQNRIPAGKTFEYVFRVDLAP
ncbi:MAG TPA: hypothetical protein DEB06_08080 [Phycisphaerales bacterium]|nr:hypothetical protein [Phycisphaerales bacterium]